MSKFTFALAAAALAVTATFAAAEPFNTAGNYFGGVTTVRANSAFDVALVTTTGAGTLSLYDYSSGVQGKLLGEVAVNQGANADLRINLGVPPQNDVLAVLTVGGQVTATQLYDVVSSR